MYTLKINCKGKRTAGKASKGINIDKITIGFKNLKKERENQKKRRKLHTTAKAQCRGRGL